MERKEAKTKIEELIGEDLRQLANKYNITVNKNGTINKGWAGHVIEAHLGLALNSKKEPDFGDWELKLCSLKYLKNGQLTVKETMAITMINENDIINTPFLDSHLLKKMKKLLIPARIWESKTEDKSILYSVTEFNLDNEEVFQQIESDYELIRKIVKEQGFSQLSGRQGTYIQPRTKGCGHGSTSRAFYSRKNLLVKILNT